jgi:Na+/melibiose symporter-like transporter
VSNSALQPDSAIAGIRLVAGVIPAVTIGLGILFTLLYPLGRENYRDITRQLEERRRTGAAP